MAQPSPSLTLLTFTVTSPGLRVLWSIHDDGHGWTGLSRHAALQLSQSIKTTAEWSWLIEDCVVCCHCSIRVAATHSSHLHIDRQTDRQTDRETERVTSLVCLTKQFIECCRLTLKHNTQKHVNCQSYLTDFRCMVSILVSSTRPFLACLTVENTSLAILTFWCGLIEPILKSVTHNLY